MHEVRYDTALTSSASEEMAPLVAVRAAVAVLAQPPATNQFTAFLALHQVLQDTAPTMIAHGERTAAYALRLADALALPWPDRIVLLFASMLHDVGMLVLPNAIREKRGPLTAEEYLQVQCHPRAGADLLWAVPSLRETAVIIAHHHERWDGGGYPYGIGGKLIPLAARILAVADTFDALLSADHGGTCGRAVALRVLQAASGSQLDPELVSVFVAPAAMHADVRADGTGLPSPFKLAGL